jgi:hypothetical protein
MMGPLGPNDSVNKKHVEHVCVSCNPEEVL